MITATKVQKITQPLSNGTGISASAELAKAIDPSMVTKISDEEANSLVEFMNRKMPPPVDDLSLQYATLVKGGKTVATFYKNGVMAVPNDTILPAKLAIDGTGKALADERIAQMLKLLGGSVQYR